MLIEKLEIQVRNDPDKFLGVPILYGRGSRGKYQFIHERVHKRLCAYLSSAGRVTLAKFVI